MIAEDGFALVALPADMIEAPFQIDPQQPGHRLSSSAWNRSQARPSKPELSIVFLT
jgi:hypothetical protein